MVLVIAAVLLVVVGVPFAAWEAWWPTNVDARALDAFGPPIPGATRTGPDWVSSGNDACLDSCSVLTRPFAVPPTSKVGQALAQAQRAAHRAGYTTPFDNNCMVTNSAKAQFMCSVVGQTTKLSVEVAVYGVNPKLVTPSTQDGEGLRFVPNETQVTNVWVDISER